jgi:hypothetical protein
MIGVKSHTSRPACFSQDGPESICLKYRLVMARDEIPPKKQEIMRECSERSHTELFKLGNIAARATEWSSLLWLKRTNLHARQDDKTTKTSCSVFFKRSPSATRDSNYYLEF